MSLDKLKVERALYKSGFTSYPYATAEALRFIRHYEEGDERPQCVIVRNGDQFLCETHRRYWATGVCPGRR